MAIHVADAEASVRFYGQAFGWREIPAQAQGPRWLDLGSGLQLHLVPGRTEPVRGPKAVHLAVQIDELDALIAILDSRRIAWGNYPGEARVINRARTDGVRQIFFQDPDGYWIEANDSGSRR